LKQLVGQTFGFLLVLEELPRRRTPLNRAMRYFKTQCVCGSSTEVSYANLTAGNVKSCGCIRPAGRLGSLVKTGAYQSWVAMKIRCLCQTSDGFKKYGARGITICDRWLDFLKFFEDMGERPEGHSIERSDNSKNYEPGNCSWATPDDQANNQTKSVRVLANGEWLTVPKAASALGLTVGQVRGRVARGRIPKRKMDKPPADTTAGVQGGLF
jgi:hypothetical protein